MANVDRVWGARPVGHTNGAPFNGQVRKYFIPATDSTAVFQGDLVKLAGSADANGVATVAQCAATDTPVGVVMFVEPNPSDLSKLYRVASTAQYVYVADSPDLVLEIQEDGVGGALAVTDIGNNADVVVGSGSTTTGQSGMELDSSTAATTSTLVLNILGFSQKADNEVGSANAKMLVTYNVHQFGSVGTAGL